jgi:hypothetical protein
MYVVKNRVGDGRVEGLQEDSPSKIGLSLSRGMKKAGSEFARLVIDIAREYWFQIFE